MGYLLETGRGKALEYQGTRVFCGAVPKIAPTSPGAERRGQGGNDRGRRQPWADPVLPDDLAAMCWEVQDRRVGKVRLKLLAGMPATVL